MEGVILHKHFVKKGGWFGLHFFAIRNYYLNFSLFLKTTEIIINFIPIRIRIIFIVRFDSSNIPNPSNRTPKKNSEIPNL